MLQFRQADCGIAEGGVSYTAPDIRTVFSGAGCEWGGAAACGGSGNCCSLCSEVRADRPSRSTDDSLAPPN